jgi:hypothetical protein
LSSVFFHSAVYLSFFPIHPSSFFVLFFPHFPAKTGHGPHSSYFLCCSLYCLFYVVLCIVCVYMCTVLLPPGGYPITVKYIIIIIIIIISTAPFLYVFLFVSQTTSLWSASLLRFYTCVRSLLWRFSRNVGTNLLSFTL